jgi:hypothetical protein
MEIRTQRTTSSRPGMSGTGTTGMTGTAPGGSLLRTSVLLDVALSGPSALAVLATAAGGTTGSAYRPAGPRDWAGSSAAGPRSACWSPSGC